MLIAIRSDAVGLALAMTKPKGRFALAVKRAIDVAGAGVGLVALAPLLAGISATLAVTQGRPIFFLQLRPGYRGRPFHICKFRTMRPPRPGEVSYLTDDQRMTRFGRFLRSSSLDELPELWNVLRGDMSLVGPRPLLMEYLDKYTDEEQRRHDMPAGLTGWAAVNGRHAIHFKKRLELDVWYVDNWSLWLDLKVLAMTVHQVLRRRDVTASQGVAEIGFPLPTDAPEGDAVTRSRQWNDR
jgi:lipopolysaccharide/colanic/teichoic acid biosynthesis glycosyltransferase